MTAAQKKTKSDGSLLLSVTHEVLARSSSTDLCPQACATALEGEVFECFKARRCMDVYKGNTHLSLSLYI